VHEASRPGGVLIGRLPPSDAEGDVRTRLCEGDLAHAPIR
jgi:hypothetical protein